MSCNFLLQDLEKSRSRQDSNPFIQQTMNFMGDIMPPTMNPADNDQTQLFGELYFNKRHVIESHSRYSAGLYIFPDRYEGLVRFDARGVSGASELLLTIAGPVLFDRDEGPSVHVLVKEFGGSARNLYFTLANLQCGSPSMFWGPRAIWGEGPTPDQQPGVVATYVFKLDPVNPPFPP
jgi:hypothetical protein